MSCTNSSILKIPDNYYEELQGLALHKSKIKHVSHNINFNNNPICGNGIRHYGPSYGREIADLERGYKIPSVLIGLPENSYNPMNQPNTGYNYSIYHT